LGQIGGGERRLEQIKNSHLIEKRSRAKSIFSGERRGKKKTESKVTSKNQRKREIRGRI